MSTGRKTTIGFDRTIHIEWLDIAAARVSRGELPTEIRKVLWDFLEDLVPGNTNSSGRGKTLTVLTRIWLTVPEQVEPLISPSTTTMCGSTSIIFSRTVC